MIQRIAWIFALTLSIVSAQQGDRLSIGNAAGVAPYGDIAPDSLAKYSVTFQKSPPNLSFETPTLTLRQGNGPEVTLDIVDGSPFSGNLYIPDTVSPGPATITATSASYRLSAEIQIVPAAPALYAVNVSRILKAQLAPAGSPVQLTRPARPGDIITLWGTGLGNATAGEIEVSIGPQPLQVLYAGHSAQYRGLDQYNLAIPATAQLPETCYAPLEMKVRGAATPIGYISTANAATGSCRHPLNLTTAQLTTLDEGGYIPMASFIISTVASAAAGEDAQVDFTRIERREEASASLGNGYAFQFAMSRQLESPEPTNACTIDTSSGLLGGIIGGGGETDPPPSLGDKVRLEGPARSWDLLRPPPERWFDSSTYTANLPVAAARYFDQLSASVWAPGKYTFSGPGDTSLEPFRVETEIPGAIRLRNPETLRTIDRARDLTLAWETESMKPADSLEIGLVNLADTTPVPFLRCTVRALDGTLTIPSSLLQQIPAAEVTTQRSPILSFSYLRPRTVAQLPRRNADPIPAFIDWSSYALIPVTLR